MNGDGAKDPPVSADPTGVGSFTWPLLKRTRRHPAAALPPRSSLSEPPENVDLDTAKAALEQVNKRLDAQLALKTTTETRAITLAGQCTTLLSAIVAGVLIEASNHQRPMLMIAGAAGGMCLFVAILFAYSSAKPRAAILPGRLPDEMWDDFLAPDMKGPEFIGRLMLGLQDTMVHNETAQVARATALNWAINLVRVAVPAAVIAAGVAMAVQRTGPPADSGAQLEAQPTSTSHPAIGVHSLNPMQGTALHSHS